PRVAAPLHGRRPAGAGDRRRRRPVARVSEALEPGTSFTSLRLQITFVEDLPDELPAWAGNLRTGARSRFLTITKPGGEATGYAVVALDLPRPGAATFDYIVIAPDERYRGLGGEAGLAIERRLREAGYGRIFAAVPDTIGLAVYFWLRLGLRPLLEAE